MRSMFPLPCGMNRRLRRKRLRPRRRPVRMPCVRFLPPRPGSAILRLLPPFPDRRPVPTGLPRRLPAESSMFVRQSLDMARRPAVLTVLPDVRPRTWIADQSMRRFSRFSSGCGRKTGFASLELSSS